MSIVQRAEMYRRIETIRQRPLLVYVTSTRAGVPASMAADAIPEWLDQLHALPAATRAADVLVVSNGGDATVAWRMMSLLRERVEKVAVLIPHAAFSAATLLALGADELQMHPNGNLGPTDTQIVINRKKPGTHEVEQIHFGSEDLAGFLDFVRHRVGLTDQEHLRILFEKFCSEVGTIAVGVSMRGSRLSLSLGEKLLRMHMSDAEGGEKAKTLAEVLNKNFFHHSYAVGRTEAKAMGLPVKDAPDGLNDIMWSIWQDIETELKCRAPFDVTAELSNGPGAQNLLGPMHQINVPLGGINPNLLAQVLMNIAAAAVVQVPATPYELISAVMESSRRASRHVITGNILAARTLDMQVTAHAMTKRIGWEAVAVPPEPTPAPRALPPGTG